MKQRQDEQPGLKFDKHTPIPGWAHSLASVGKETEAAIYTYFETDAPGRAVFRGYPEDELNELAQALGRWADAPASQIIEFLIDLASGGARLALRSIARWVLLHSNDPDSVIDCISIEPPGEVEVVRVLSRRGSQKLVFEATWHTLQRRVVLKKVLHGNIAHESNAHPLSLQHPNIIETHILRNSKGEAFLVEQWLPEVLNDNSACRGIQEASNLLHNLADAVAFVHKQSLVHGDIKPDNIGKRDDAFILLDFGISRPVAEFSRDTTATGSLRTRAPELLVSDAYCAAPGKVDIWAIGATLFNFLVGRFPLIERDEDIPRISRPQERQRFEQELARRVREEWDARVTVDKIDEPLRHILGRTLALDPASRPTASELHKMAEKELSLFLRRESTAEYFSPIEELHQLRTYLPSADVLSVMPAEERTRFKIRLATLRDISGFNDEQRRQMEDLEHALNA